MAAKTIIKRLICAFFIICIHSTCTSIHTINITKGIYKPVIIAVCDFLGNEPQVGNNMRNVIINDLRGTGLFSPQDKIVFMEKITQFDRKPIFSNWKMINSQYTAVCEVKKIGPELRVRFCLYDIFAERLVENFSYKSTYSNWRKIAHMIANIIYKRAIGEEGYFDTKILYVSTTKSKGHHKKYRLSIMDQDGFNNQFITNGDSIELTPRLSPNGDEFTFFSYKKKKMKNGRTMPYKGSLFKYSFSKKRITLLGDFDGMTYSPRYSPDGKYLIFSISKNGASSIYKMSMENKKITRLTYGRCIDTSPCYSPNGTHIIFNSDRGGNQQLYIMEADGSNIKRLSFGSGRYATPVWSPRGDWIAFTKFNRTGFYIGVIKPDGSGERMIACGYLVEGPTWSPNGRVVMYSCQNRNGRNKICSVDVTGMNNKELNTPTDAIDPEWSVYRY